MQRSHPLFSRHQQGATSVEYIMIISIIAMLVAFTISFMTKGDTDSSQLKPLTVATNTAVKQRLKNNDTAFNNMTSAVLARTPKVRPASGAFVERDSAKEGDVWFYAVSQDGSVNTEVQHGTKYGIALCNSSTAAVTCARALIRPGKADDVTYSEGKTLRAATTDGAWNHRFDTSGR